MSAALPVAACCSCPCSSGSTDAIPEASCDCSFVVKENAEDARAFNPATVTLPAILHTQGGLVPGDTLGKTFWYNEASFEVDDGTEFTVVIKPVTIDAGSPGRWEQTSLA